MNHKRVLLLPGARRKPTTNQNALSRGLITPELLYLKSAQFRRKTIKKKRSRMNRSCSSSMSPAGVMIFKCLVFNGKNLMVFNCLGFAVL